MIAAQSGAHDNAVTVDGQAPGIGGLLCKLYGCLITMLYT